MLKPINRMKWATVLLCLVVFLTMLVFFTVLHPIPIMDEDDVIYSVLVRKAIPIPGAWNPSRMMPEMLTSLCGNLAALCAALGFGRFIDCQVVVLAILFSLFITVYIGMFFSLLKTRFNSGMFQAICLSVLFLMLHFLVFRTEYMRNNHMFHTYDACCVFYYTVPALLGCTLVMHFMMTPDEAPVLYGKQIVRESILVLLLYCEVFSNLFGSVIVASYAGYRFYRNVVCRHLRKKRIIEKKEDNNTNYQKENCDKCGDTIQSVDNTFWKQNIVWISIVAFWLIAFVMEATGGRAAGARNQMASGTMTLAVKLVQAASIFLGTVWNCNLLFKLMFVAVAVLSLVFVVVKPYSNESIRFLRALGETAVWGLGAGLAVLILCAAADPQYAARPEVFFPIIFVLFMLVVLGINLILQGIPFLVRLLPILLIIVYSMINTRFLTFQDSNPLLLDGHVAVAIENEIYQSIIEAAKAGETEITVNVIHSSEGANWPHDPRVADPIAKLFHKYGIIDHEILVHTQPSDAMNRKYHIPIP